MSMYPEEHLDDSVDDGTMPMSRKELEDAVVGHRIVRVDRWIPNDVVLTLDNGKRVEVRSSDDCCAYTEVEDFLLHADKIDHIITGVGTTDGYETWHIYADAGDVLEMKVNWSCGNPFYYGYGFYIKVREVGT